MTQTIVPGSVQAVAKGGDVALALLGTKLVLICDRSSSMLEPAWGGRTKCEIENGIVTRLQSRHPGQVALIAFNNTAWLCVNGGLPPATGSTCMVAGLELARPLIEAGVRAVLVSDGQPTDSEQHVLRVATTMRGKLDTIFVGPEGSPGANFLMRLAKAVGGTHSVYDLSEGPSLLEMGLTRLLLTTGAGR